MGSQAVAKVCQRHATAYGTSTPETGQSGPDPFRSFNDRLSDWPHDRIRCSLELAGLNYFSFTSLGVATELWPTAFYDPLDV